jgi:hypothetical protein
MLYNLIQPGQGDTTILVPVEVGYGFIAGGFLAAALFACTRP